MSEAIDTGERPVAEPRLARRQRTEDPCERRPGPAADVDGERDREDAREPERARGDQQARGDGVAEAGRQCGERHDQRQRDRHEPQAPVHEQRDRRRRHAHVARPGREPLEREEAAAGDGAPGQQGEARPAHRQPEGERSPVRHRDPGAGPTLRAAPTSAP
jgi:hypothetical protein